MAGARQRRGGDRTDQRRRPARRRSRRRPLRPDATSTAGCESYVLDERLGDLADRCGGLGSLAVAFSGGADSAFLLAAAVRALGPDRVRRRHRGLRQPARHRAGRGPAVRGRPRRTAPHPRDRRAGARRLPRRTPATAATSARPSCSTWSARSPPRRASSTWPPARTPTTRSRDSGPASGRPPSAARVTPLLDAGLTKDAGAGGQPPWGLVTWDKPAAACLSSRIAYGVQITPARLARVERAETALRAALAAAGIDVGEPAGARPRRHRPRGGRQRPGRGRGERRPRSCEPSATPGSTWSSWTRAASGPAR